MRQPFQLHEHDSLRKYAPKRSHLDAFENSASRVRVAAGKGPCFRFAVHVDDDQAAASIGKGSGNRDFALFCEGSQIVQMGGPKFRPEFGAVRPVVPDYHKEHHSPSRKQTADQSWLNSTLRRAEKRKGPGSADCN